MRDDYPSTSDDGRGERQFAAQILRALREGYAVSWSEESGFLVEGNGSQIKISHRSFGGDAGQAADAIRRGIDRDKAAGHHGKARPAGGTPTFRAYVPPSYQRPATYRWELGIDEKSG